MFEANSLSDFVWPPTKHKYEEEEQQQSVVLVVVVAVFVSEQERA